MGAKVNHNQQILTNDGSWTLYSREYEETYHSRSGAIEESEKKFIQPCRIESLARSEKKLRILDVCFGLGYNALFAWHTVKTINPLLELEIVSLEKDEALLEGLGALSLPSPLSEYQSLLGDLVECGSYRDGTRLIRLEIGEATEMLNKMAGKFQAVFWDPFSPPKNPEMWTLAMFENVRSIMEPKTILATYSANQRMRKGMQLAGLKIGLVPAVGRKKGGTLPSIEAELSQIAQADLIKISNVNSFK